MRFSGIGDIVRNRKLRGSDVAIRQGVKVGDEGERNPPFGCARAGSPADAECNSAQRSWERAFASAAGACGPAPRPRGGDALAGVKERRPHGVFQTTREQHRRAGRVRTVRYMVRDVEFILFCPRGPERGMVFSGPWRVVCARTSKKFGFDSTFFRFARDVFFLPVAATR